MHKLWKLTSFDIFCLGMIIKSAWIYREAPDFEKMKSALETLAAMYPHLSGHYDEKEKSVVWDDSAKPQLPFDTLDLRKYGIAELSGNARLAWSLVKPYDVKGFKKGLVPAFSATLGYLKDGCILYVQCAHATMDGHTFHALINQWAAIYRGEDTSAMEVSQDWISSLKAESGAGTNAVLSAIVVGKMAERLPEKKSFKMLFTTDLRERINGIGDDFFGNLSQPAVIEGEVPADIGIASIAATIDKGLKEALEPDTLEGNMQLYMCSSHYGLPYVHFDASDMNCPGNGTIIINNFLKFRANVLDWGLGIPLYSFTNELPDMVKLWQPVAGGPVQIIFGGYAAKMMAKG